MSLKKAMQISCALGLLILPRAYSQSTVQWDISTLSTTLLGLFPGTPGTDELYQFSIEGTAFVDGNEVRVRGESYAIAELGQPLYFFAGSDPTSSFGFDNIATFYQLPPNRDNGMGPPSTLNSFAVSINVLTSGYALHAIELGAARVVNGLDHAEIWNEGLDEIISLETTPYAFDDAPILSDGTLRYTPSTTGWYQYRGIVTPGTTTANYNVFTEHTGEGSVVYTILAATVVAVPEPASSVLVSLFGVLGLWRRRR